VTAQTKAWLFGRQLAGIVGSIPVRGMYVSCGCSVLSDRGPCDGPSARPEESYHVFVYVSLSAIRYNNNSLHLQSIGRKRSKLRKKEKKKWENYFETRHCFVWLKEPFLTYVKVAIRTVVLCLIYLSPSLQWTYFNVILVVRVDSPNTFRAGRFLQLIILYYLQLPHYNSTESKQKLRINIVKISYII